MCRLTSCTTEAGSVASDSRATAPTTAWPESKSTIDGVVGDPSAFGRTTGSPALLTCATTDIVVPRSMPNAVLSSSGSATAHAPAQSLPAQPPYRGGQPGAGEQQQRQPRAGQPGRRVRVEAGCLVQRGGG